ncbi:DUF5818 domain-containing protein [Sphingobium sp.]|uniref:DUF5818 domain-containing protein n=1 Tax=Sphingobium sp. TaxID=1912891 RepID=UPI002E1B1F57
MCCVIGASKQGVIVSSGRIRVSGTLSRGRRGMILTTNDDGVWIIDSEEPVDGLVGTDVIVDGTVVGLDRLKADWIGVSSTGT